MGTNTITLVKLIQQSNMVKDLTNFEKAISTSVREKQININSPDSKSKRALGLVRKACRDLF